MKRLASLIAFTFLALSAHAQLDLGLRAGAGLSRANLFLGITLNHDFNENLEYLRPLFKTGRWKKNEI